MLVEKTVDLQHSQLPWLRLEQEFSFELEDSFYWLLSKLDIHRFSFEHDPNNNVSKTLFIWLPLNEWSVRDQEILVQSLISLTKPFKLTLYAENYLPRSRCQLRLNSFNVLRLSCFGNHM